MKELIINVCNDKYRIATLENGDLVDYQIEYRNKDFSIGDIFLGSVKSKPQNLEAAFIFLNSVRDGFLHIDDFGENSLTFVEFCKEYKKNNDIKVSTFKHVKEEEDTYSHSYGPNDTFLIENKKSANIKKNFDLLPIGCNTLVQIIKEPLANKGARVSTRISLAGKYLILIPFSNKINISKKITDNDIREKLIKTLTILIKNELKLSNFGLVLRTSILKLNNITSQDFIDKIKSDLITLLKKWSICLTNLKTAQVGTRILNGDIRLLEILKDQISDVFDVIHIDDKGIYEKIKQEFKDDLPAKKGIKLYKNSNISLFASKNIDKQIKLLLSKNVSFGDNSGYLIIEKTEAMHVIDVNSGHNNIIANNHEEMVYEANIAAAKEIARQIRLRDMGGIIAIDFIDMKIQKHKDNIYYTMQELLKNDKSDSNILPLSKFNVMMITRERVRDMSLSEINNETCPQCHGKGSIESSIQIMDNIIRQICDNIKNIKYKNITLFLHPLLHAYFTKNFISLKKKLEWKYWKNIDVKIDYEFSIFDFKIKSNNGTIISSIMNKTNNNNTIKQ